MIFIYAIAYIFVGAIIDRLMGDKPNPTGILVWPLFLVMAVAMWCADELIKFFRPKKETVDPMDPLSIKIQAEEYANALPIDFEDKIISSGQLRHYAKKDFVAGAKWVLTKLPKS